MTDLGQMFREIPRFTRYWFATTLAMSVLMRFGLLPMEYAMLTRTQVLEHFQLWRCITSLFVYPLYPGSAGFHFMINCFFILQYSARLEKDQFGRAPADYLYQLLFSSLMCILCGLLFKLPFLMDPLVVSVTYIWCHLNQDVIVTFWFGTRFKAVYLPWVLAGINLIFNGSIDSLIGIFVGHLYYFLKFQYPQELGGGEFLQTPSLLKQYVPDVNGGMGGFGMPADTRAQPAAPPAGNRLLGNTWGRGNALGRD